MITPLAVPDVGVPVTTAPLSPLAGSPVAVETYYDIVWKQFRKNTLAYFALWSMLPAIAVAIYAPLIGSSEPLVYQDGAQRIYPWFRALFNTAEQVDLLFNMALLSSPFWLAAVLLQNVFWARHGWKMRERVALALTQFVMTTLLLYGLFGGIKFEPTAWAPGETRAWFWNKLQLSATPWLFAVLVQNGFWKRAGLSVPARVLLAGFQFLALLAGLCFALSGTKLPAGLGTSGIVKLQPSHLMLLAQAALLPWLLSLLAQAGTVGAKSFRAGKVALAVLQFLVIAASIGLAWAGPQWRPDNRYGARAFGVEDFKSGSPQKGLYVLIPYGPLRQDLDVVFQPPFSRKPADKWTDIADRYPHFLGTDDSGRDIFVRMVYGMRISMTVGFVAVGIYLTIGCIIGAVAGYFGGWIDILINRVIEVVLLFPAFFLILTLVGMLGGNIYLIMVVIGITGWPSIARLVRGEVLKQRSADYVTAGRALGLSNTRIIFQHILPNSLSPALVAAPFGIASARDPIRCTA